MRFHFSYAGMMTIARLGARTLPRALVALTTLLYLRPILAASQSDTQLMGLWQAENDAYPHFAYNPFEQQLNYTLGYTVNEQTCAVQFHATATTAMGFTTQNGLYFKFSSTLDSNQTALIQPTPACEKWLAANPVRKTLDSATFQLINALTLKMHIVLNDEQQDIIMKKSVRHLAQFAASHDRMNSLVSTFHAQDALNSLATQFARDIATHCDAATRLVDPTHENFISVNVQRECATGSQMISALVYTAPLHVTGYDCAATRFSPFIEANVEWPKLCKSAQDSAKQETNWDLLPIIENPITPLFLLGRVGHFKKTANTTLIHHKESIAFTQFLNLTLNLTQPFFNLTTPTNSTDPLMDEGDSSMETADWITLGIVVPIAIALTVGMYQYFRDKRLRIDAQFGLIKHDATESDSKAHHDILYGASH